MSTTDLTMSARDGHPTSRPQRRHAVRIPRGILTYARLDLRRLLRDRTSMFFAVALPGFFFLVFGIGADQPYGSANVGMYVMVSMAAYGAVTATTTVAGTAATEQLMGWGRQLALTPLPSLAFVAVKTGVAMVVASVPIGLIYLIGVVTGASGTASDWALSALVVWVGSSIFAIYGLAVCLVFKGQNTASIASGLIVIMAFLGNVFLPMDGIILAIGRFTPLYGYAGLARFPLTGGELPNGAGQDSVWLLLANVGVWIVIFAALAVWGLRRRQERT